MKRTGRPANPHGPGPGWRRPGLDDPGLDPTRAPLIYGASLGGAIAAQGRAWPDRTRADPPQHQFY